MVDITITKSEIQWLENKLENIVKDDIGEEVSDFTIVEDLHFTCKTDEDYRSVIDFIKNNPEAKRNDIIVLLLNIRKKRK